MSEKHPLLAAEEKCFYLTSPFIEPDGHGNANTVRLTCELFLAISSHIDRRTQSCAVSDLRLCRVKIRGSENCIFLSQSLLMSLSSFIWSVADLLRGGYKQSECGKVIPFSRPFYVFSRRAEGRHG